MGQTKLGGCIVYVRDVVAAASFYERAFGMKRRFLAPGGSYLEMDCDPPLGFADEQFVEGNLGAPFARARRETPPGPFEIVLVFEDVGAAFARALEAGAQVVTRPTQKPWGQTVAYVRDLDGVLVEICTAWSAPPA